MLRHRISYNVLDSFGASAHYTFRRYGSKTSCNSFQESSHPSTDNISETPLLDSVNRLIGDGGWTADAGGLLPQTLCENVNNSFLIPQMSASLLCSIQEQLEIEASLLLLMFGMLARIFTLIFSFYGDRATSRMIHALPELKVIQKAYENTATSGTALENHSLLVTLNKKRKLILQKHQTSTFKCFSSLVAAPVVWFGFATTSIFSSLHQSSSSAFLWCDSISQADTTCRLPFACCVLSLLNFELLLPSTLKKERWMKLIVWGARFCTLLLTPVVGSFQSGVCVFWLGMNIIGTCQPLLLRSTTFRRRFRFPPMVSSTPLNSQ